MGLYVGIALGALGVIMVVAGARNRGAELFSAVTGGSALGTSVGGASYTAPSTGPTTLPAASAGPSLPGGVMFA